MTEKTSDDSTPEVNKEEELDDEALFGDIGGLFGDPQNCHGDMQHPFVYVWPKPLDDDDISLYTNPPPGKKVGASFWQSSPPNHIPYLYPITTLI